MTPDVVQHVVEEAHAGAGLDPAGTVEVEVTSIRVSLVERRTVARRCGFEPRAMRLPDFVGRLLTRSTP